MAGILIPSGAAVVGGAHPTTVMGGAHPILSSLFRNFHIQLSDGAVLVFKLGLPTCAAARTFIKIFPSAMTNEYFPEIVARASFLSERLHGQFPVASPQNSEEEARGEQLLTGWCNVTASGNWENFHKRLEWDNLDVETARSLLAGTPSLPDVMPAWADTLKYIISSAAEFHSRDKSAPAPLLPTNAEEPLPFEDILLPIVLSARQKLLDIIGALPDVISESVYLSLERSLLESLSHLSEKTLEYEFSRFRPLGYSLLNLLFLQNAQTPDNPQAAPKADNTYYNSFVAKLLDDGLLTFFHKYPVLGRLIATNIDLWAIATSEFISRLKADLPEIQVVFAGEEIGKLVKVKTNLSDPHNGRRTVIGIEFESELKLIYKPKNLGLEVAYNEFLKWCNEQSALGEEILPFKVLKVLNRDSYGWVEYVEQHSCTEAAAAQRFYRRAGMLLCLLYVLRANDCHFENLVADGEHLVLIDMETLLHHTAKNVEDLPEIVRAEKSAVNQEFWDSVLRTAMLPAWQLDTDKRIAYDLSGLGSVDAQQAPARMPVWKHINTDNMQLVYEEFKIPLQKNVPMLNDVPLQPNDYLDDIVNGCEQMYRFLMKHREVLLSDNGPLQVFQNQKVRFLFRATAVYRKTLDESCTPKFLRDGIDWSIEIEALCHAFVIWKEKPKTWTIFLSEIKAMEQLDVPYFALYSSSTRLEIGTIAPIEDYARKPSYNEVIAVLDKLSLADLALQVAIIRDTFYARVATTAANAKTDSAILILEESEIKSVKPWSAEQCQNEAVEIAKIIEQRALSGADGRVNWITLGYIFGADRYELRILAESLYDGNCGIALFLAALARVTGNAAYRDLAIGTLKPLREFLQLAGEGTLRMFVKSYGLGGATGLGSLVYSLVKISSFLEESSLLADALRIAEFVTPELIAKDEQFDLVGGAGGEILGLLALYAATGDRTILDKAVLCGQHLLEHRISSGDTSSLLNSEDTSSLLNSEDTSSLLNSEDTSSLRAKRSNRRAPRAWKTIYEKPLTGFAHGAAGIGYALLRLYAVTGDSAYKEAAQEAIDYEGLHFNPEAANWRDLRYRGKEHHPNAPEFQVRWCHGAAGIGLGRLGGLSILDTAEIRQDIEAALYTTENHSWVDIDHLCCGRFGRIETLVVGASKLERPDLLESARQKAAVLAETAARAGGYRLVPNLPPQVFMPTFFVGTAGIGYQLLRLAHPQLLPSVLLWE